MDELTLDNKKYLSSKKAASVTGYAKDYVGQLCREGRIEARLVGRNWYVLESSILEHRFGPAEEAKPEKAEIPATQAWETPRYISEPVTAVPELTPKLPEAPKPSPEANRVLADMQSAWKEWIETKHQEPPALPEVLDMLLEAPQQEEEQAVAREDFFPVHIARHSEPEPHDDFIEPAYEPVAHVEVRRAAPRPVEMRRIDSEEPLVRGSFMGAQAAAPARRERKQHPERLKVRRYKTKTNSFVQNAVLLSVAGLAVAVAVIGSGVADAYLPSRGAGTPITDFLSGIQTVK